MRALRYLSSGLRTGAICRLPRASNAASGRSRALEGARRSGSLREMARGASPDLSRVIMLPTR